MTCKVRNLRGIGWTWRARVVVVVVALLFSAEVSEAACQHKVESIEEQLIYSGLAKVHE